MADRFDARQPAKAVRAELPVRFEGNVGPQLWQEVGALLPGRFRSINGCFRQERTFTRNSLTDLKWVGSRRYSRRSCGRSRRLKPVGCSTLALSYRNQCSRGYGQESAFPCHAPHLSDHCVLVRLIKAGPVGRHAEQ